MGQVTREPIRLVPMTAEHAVDICTWRYPAPYDCYDMSATDASVLLRPELAFHGVLRGDALIGFRSFGPDGRVPGFEYDDSALDTGGGLRPALVGHRLGGDALAAGLAHGRAQFAPDAFRVTIASFNERALKVARRVGFEPTAEFTSPDGRSFQVLVRPER